MKSLKIDFITSIRAVVYLFTYFFFYLSICFIWDAYAL